ncbi:MAG: hypothetical protein Q8941_16810 [Bacteroidota bacterium]|nr:hypothetical protein [Bacteroidota bacterium]
MQEPFITYKVFTDPALAVEFAEVLNQYSIPFKVEEDAYNFDPSYANHPLNKDYRLKIRQRDFTEANAAFENFFKGYVDSIDKNYYLYDFTDEELMEILAKPDEWGGLDYQLAQKILKNRGKEITARELDDFKKKRLEELKKPEKTEYTSIIMGYLCSLLLFPVGIFLGYMLLCAKKTLPDGQKIYAYSKTQRFHGELIMVISSAIFLLAFLRIFFFNKN